VRRGAPIIVEIGPRDATGNVVTFMRREALRDGDKIRSHAMPREEFVKAVPKMLAEAQATLFREAKAMLDKNIVTGIKDFGELAEFFGAGVDEDEGSEFKGWVRASWSRPSGAGLEEVEKRLKQLKLTLRNAPLNQPSSFGKCIFTGTDGVEEILIARAY
jgi:prolyl-tRNA synthetase